MNKETRIRQLEQTNREQRDEIDKLKEVINRLQEADLEKTKSLRNRFKEITEIGHSNNTYKNMEMTNIAEKTVKELNQDIDDMLFIPNDEKILELPRPASIR